jgi:hypothetical protein
VMSQDNDRNSRVRNYRTDADLKDTNAMQTKTMMSVSLQLVLFIELFPVETHDLGL